MRHWWMRVKDHECHRNHLYKAFCHDGTFSCAGNILKSQYLDLKKIWFEWDILRIQELSQNLPRDAPAMLPDQRETISWRSEELVQTEHTEELEFDLGSKPLLSCAAGFIFGLLWMYWRRIGCCRGSWLCVAIFTSWMEYGCGGCGLCVFFFFFGLSSGLVMCANEVSMKLRYCALW